MTTREAIYLIERAKTATDLLGIADPRAEFHRLAKLVHPDVIPRDLKESGEGAIAKLSGFYAKLTGKSVKRPVILGDWEIEEPLAKGDVADLYVVSPLLSREKGEPKSSVLKIARSPKDNDLIASEVRSLHRVKEFDNVSYSKYVPTLYDKFMASGRYVSVASRAAGYYTLGEILELKPNLDFRHVVWMMNRLLSALGFVHSLELVHGAVTPEHLLYHPEQHGMVLVDWCYSVGIGEKLVAAPAKYRKVYPPEISRGRRVARSLDTYMAAKSLLRSGVKVPARFKPLMDHMLAESPASRAQDAWAIQDRWIELAKQEYGPPTYLKLEIKAV